MTEENRNNDIYDEADSGTTPRRSRSQTGKRKTNKTPKEPGQKGRKGRKIRWKTVFMVLGITALLCFVVLGGIVFSIVKNTPPIDPTNFYSLLSENSVLYDMNGEKIEDIQTQDGVRRTNIPYAQIPKNLQNAVISIEDKTFWKHNGFNFTRLAGAVVESIVTLEGASGTSTITQQLARNLYLELDRNWTRKIKEAYYTVLIEKALSKEQILEAYLNTINFGNGYGVQAAAQSYFSKDVSELTIAECAMLASMPQSPSRYMAIKKYENNDVPDTVLPENILDVGEQYTLVYNDGFKKRQEMVLKFMLENGYISEAEYQEALAENIRDALKPTLEAAGGISSYFSDYVIKQVKADLIAQKGYTEEEATNLVYSGGLQIYGTLDMKMQMAAEAEFDKNENFPTAPIGNAGKVKRDPKTNDIVDSTGRTMLYKFSNYFDEEKNLILKSDEFQKAANGDLILLKGKKLNFYKSKNSDGSTETTIDFKKIYIVENKLLYSYNGGALLIPAKYKELDDEKNLVISSEFVTENPDFFKFKDDGTIRVAKTGTSVNGEGKEVTKDQYTLRQKLIQPQSAIVVLDQTNGQIRTMVGGRNVEGKMIFNRAINPNSPGSSIKPIGTFLPALVMGKTAATVIDDCENIVDGKPWPSNHNNKYAGLVSMRYALQQSINVAAVKMQTEVGPVASADMLKALGVTTVVEKGQSNDMNPSALALGGMTNGISPLEMAAAYATIANGGVYNKPICYTQVTTRDGQVVLEAKAESHKVVEPEVAYVMTDILKSVVTQGIAGRAQVSGIPTAGKTGTTSNNYDAWFCGFTPYYTAAVWIGNDVDIDLGEGSSRAAGLWSKVLVKGHKGLKAKNFPSAPAGTIVTVEIDKISGKLPTDLSRLDPRGTIKSEIFVKGTEPVEMDDFHVTGIVCSESKFLVTPYCPTPKSSVFVKRPDGWTGAKAEDLEYELPKYYCPLHNPDVIAYPIAPDAKLRPFTPVEIPDTGETTEPATTTSTNTSIVVTTNSGTGTN